MAHQRGAEADEGGALRGGLVGREAAEAAEDGSVVQRLGQAHIREVVPGREQQAAEQRQRRPTRFTFGRSRDAGEQAVDLGPVHQGRDQVQRRAATRFQATDRPLLLPDPPPRHRRLRAAQHDNESDCAAPDAGRCLGLEGWSRQDAAAACATDRQTLRDWVHRYNEAGLDGLRNRPRRNGPSPRLSPERQAQVAEWVEQGPALERDGVVRWRCIDLQRRIKEEFAVALHEGTVGKLLHRLNFTPSQMR